MFADAAHNELTARCRVVVAADVVATRGAARYAPARTPALVRLRNRPSGSATVHGADRQQLLFNAARLSGSRRNQCPATTFYENFKHDVRNGCFP